jgi:hypothetical protein
MSSTAVDTTMSTPTFTDLSDNNVAAAATTTNASDALTSSTGALAKFLLQKLEEYQRDPSKFSHQPAVLPNSDQTFWFINRIANDTKFIKRGSDVAAPPTTTTATATTSDNPTVASDATVKWGYVFSSFFTSPHVLLPYNENEWEIINFDTPIRFVGPSTHRQKDGILVTWIMIDRYTAMLMHGADIAPDVHREPESEFATDVYIRVRDRPIADIKNYDDLVAGWERTIVEVDEIFKTGAKSWSEALQELDKIEQSMMLKLSSSSSSTTTVTPVVDDAIIQDAPPNAFTTVNSDMQDVDQKK